MACPTWVLHVRHGKNKPPPLDRLALAGWYRSHAVAFRPPCRTTVNHHRACQYAPRAGCSALRPGTTFLGRSRPGSLRERQPTLHVLVLGCLGLIPPVQRQRRTSSSSPGSASPRNTRHSRLPRVATSSVGCRDAVGQSPRQCSGTVRLEGHGRRRRGRIKRTPAAIIGRFPGFLRKSVDLSEPRACHPNTIIRPTLR